MADGMTSNFNRYQERLVRVLEFIDSHLDESLSVESLSDIAAFSKFHFHRQFYTFFGVNVSKLIQLSRLNRAVQQLAYRDLPIIEIALNNGYESPEAFTRAFKKTVGQTPSEFRTAPQWKTWESIYEPIRALRMTHMIANVQRRVDIITTADIKIAVLEHRGDPNHIGDSIRKFIEWRKQNKLHPGKHATFNILYDDPETVESSQYRHDLCVTTDMEISASPGGMVSKVIPGGRCAVLRHTGSDDLLKASVCYLYSTWLPENGEELRDFPLYLQRVKFFPDVPENEAIVDIFLPLK